MKFDFLRKIALVLVIVLLLTGFAGCKSGGGDEEGSASVDEFVEGEEQTPSNDTPTIVPNDKNNNGGSENEQPNNNQNNQQNNNQNNEQNNGQNNEQNNEQGNQEEPDDQQPDTQEPDAEQGGDEEPEKTKPAYDPNKKLTIMSYNIKCAWYGKTIDQVVKQLKEIDADIIGLQEVDCNTTRSTGGNQIETIAGKAGYPYYYFAPVIQLGGDKTQHADPNLKTSAYGHAILSKYPIKKSEIIWPDAQSAEGECRNFERHEIDVNGKTVAFYNCHLDTNKGSEQYFYVQEKYMANDKYAICVGDFNETLSERMNVYFDNDNFYSFAFGEEAMASVMRGSGSNKSEVIDHIIVSRNTIAWYDEEVQYGYYSKPHDGASDHAMVYAYINLLD